MLVPNIAIELDEGTTFDAITSTPALGTLVRQQDSLFVSTTPNGRASSNTLVPVYLDFPKSTDDGRGLQEMANCTRRRFIEADLDDNRSHALEQLRDWRAALPSQMAMREGNG